MFTLEDVYADLESQDVPIFQHEVGERKAATIEVYNAYAIFIDESQFATTAALKCGLLHEGGHAVTGTTHKLYSPFELIERYEFRANKRAWFRWMLPEAFEEAFGEGCHTTSELAEWFDMPEWYVVEAWRYYRDNNLISLASDEVG